MEKCVKDTNGWFLAIKKSNLSLIQSLSKTFENVDTTTTLSINHLEHKNVTGLTFAAYIGNKDVVRWFLTKNANPNAKTHLGWRPVHFASKRGHVATVDMLVQQGADVNVYTRENETPLMLAQQSRMWDTVRKLKQLGATDDEKSEDFSMRSTSVRGSDNRKKKNQPKSVNQAARGPISRSNGARAHPTDVLIKHLQHQNSPFDIDLSRQKSEFTSQTLNLPSPFSNRHNALFYKFLKKLTAANIVHNVRVSAAREIIEVIKSAGSKSQRSSMNDTAPKTSRSLESCLRALELTVCERHCSSELISLIADIAVRLVVMFKPHEKNENFSDMNNTSVIAYVARLVKRLSGNQSWQYRAGVLSLIGSIISKYSPSKRIHSSTNHGSQLVVSLISELIAFTDSLDQVENVSRLVNFISLVGDHNPTDFGCRFSDLADILVGWCVDSSDTHHSVALGSLLNQICANFSKWWFDTSGEFEVSHSSCDMLSHLIEDADHSLRKSLTEHHRLSSAHGNRRSQQVIPQNDVSQNLIAAKLYFSVLAGVCSSILRHTAQSSPSGQVSLTFMNQSEWHNRLISILQTLGMLTSVISVKSTHSSTSRTLIPPSYCVPLLTYGEILRHIHEILLFTESTIPLEEDYIGLNIDAFLMQPQGSLVLQTSSQHTQGLCKLAYNLLKRTSSRSHNEAIETFQALFAPGTLLHRLKTSRSGSLEVLNLLLKLAENCDLLVPVVDMCVLDLKFVCSKMSDIERPENSHDELRVLFSISLFNAVWRSFSDRNEQVFSLNDAVVRIFSNFAEMRLRTHLFQIIPQRIRLAIWSLVLLPLRHGINKISNWSRDLFSVTDVLLKTASLNVQELVLINHVLDSAGDALETSISGSLSSYLLRLAKSPHSPVRANDGGHFCEALGHLIRLWKDRKANEDIFKLANLCVNHPLPRIQARGADLLIIFGLSLKHLKSSYVKNSLLYWYLNTDIEASTSLVSASSSEAITFATSEDALLQHGAFPSVPGAAGLFSIVTRGAPPPCTDSIGFNLLEHSADYLRRLACLVAPFRTDASASNWLAEDVSPLTIISQFTSSSIADNKLRVAPWVNPINTFLSVEGAIHALLANLTGRSKNYDYAKDLKAFFDIPNDILSCQSMSRQINQAGVLLTFMRSLERAIMNGVDGYAAAMPPSPLSTHVFLRANSTTCIKWLNRIRVPLATLASWISAASLHGVEAPATVVWNIYCILHQTPNANPQEFFNVLAFLDNPEKIILLLIQALHQMRAANELELVHRYLERLALNTTNLEMHIFSWIRGLVQILRGCLDEGLICLFDFFETYPDSPPLGSLGALSYEFARRLFTNILVRVGGSKLRLGTKKEEFLEACGSQGDTPTNKLRVVCKNGKRGVASDGLLFRQPDVAKYRIKALQKLSSWDNSLPLMPKPSEALASFGAEQENRLLSGVSTSISDVTRAIRRTAVAVVPLVDLSNSHSECSLHLDAESSLQTLALEADMLVAKSSTPWPAVVDVGLGTWSLMIQKGGNPSVFLDACEPLLISNDGNSLPTDHSRGVALSLLHQQLKIMGITEELNNYNELVNSITTRVDLHPCERLRFIRYIANLLWTSKEGDIKSHRIAAMRCLSEGLVHTITALDDGWSDEHAKNCLLNVSVALQLFKCLSYPSSSSSSSREVRNMCHEAFDIFTSGDELAGRLNDASRLVKNLRLFGQMASVPWVSGMPSRIPASTDGTGHPLEDFSPSELQMRLLMFATNISLTNASASAWLEMAHWCYERGQSEVKQTKTEAKRLLELPKSEVLTTSILDSLTPEDRDCLSRLIPSEAGKDVSIEARIVAKIYAFLDKTSDGFRSCRSCIEDLSDPDRSLNCELRDAFMEYLTEETCLTDEALALNGNLVAECSSLAAVLTSRLYALQSISAQAYVTFLAVAGRRFVRGSARERIRPLNSTRAALRLLSLLNEPSRALRETVAGLITHGIIKNSSTSLISDSIDSHTNSIVWTGCLPQILDRLGHPDPSVRQCLIDLLSRLIHTTKSTSSNSDRVLAKHLVYPALVGCRGVDYAQSEAKVESHTKLVLALVDAGYSYMVDQVSDFIAEMRRITVLWDELWFGILTQHVDDFSKGLTTLEQEIDLDKECSVHTTDIQRLRCESLLAPTFSIFEQLYALTLDVAAETPHEFWFQTTYRKHIEETLKTLKQFCVSQPPDDNRKLLEPLQRLLARFQTLNQDPKMGKYEGVGMDEDEEQRKESRENAIKKKRRIHVTISNRSLNLGEISPILLALNEKSSIPLPGRAQSHLFHIAPSISVYPTKTRPKRLMFLNQKGQSLPYLLKCFEDLRLDERIMGLMRLTNIAFSSNGLPTPSTTQTYSITPIGPKAGLIQMVQGAVPLFTLYKRWQQRIAADLTVDEAKDASEIVTPIKPSDLFYQKLKEHLPEHLANTNSRQFWPKEVLLKIFKELESQTPQDLMTRELWAASPNMSAWWRVHQTYATCLGVTSAFGYLVGLGDRHLDNLLLDLSTGRLIHIDFNVSFDEGRSLRVPELVPFRLTRILRHALGPFSDLGAGCGGTFGSSFLETLHMCRSIQELFYMHLQSFEIDPLSNWMRATSSGVSWSSFDLTYFAAFRGGCMPISRDQITKRERVLKRLTVEAERSVGLMAARMIELRIEEAPWQTKLDSSLKNLAENLTAWRIYYEKQKEFDRVTNQLSILKSKSEGKAQLVAFQRRYSEFQYASIQVRSAIERIDSFANDLTTSADDCLNLLNNWLYQSFESPNSNFSKLISEYRKNAQVYIVPEDSKLHFSRTNTTWFINKRNVASALKQAVTTSNVVMSFKKLYSQVSRPRPDVSFSASLQNALEEAQSNLDSLKNQHFIPSSFDQNSLFTIIDQSHANLVSFIHEHELSIIQAAYNLSLIRNLMAWINAMLEPQSMVQIDVLYQHTATIACSLSVLDPSGGAIGLPFWAGKEADANSELKFFCTVHNLIERIVDLRNSLCRGLLPTLESVLRQASESELQLLDRIQELLNSSESALLLQQETNRLVIEDSNNPLAEVFKQIHVALSTATTEMETSCQTLANYPITASTWIHVDWIAQAIAPLESRCTADVGATSLWGWRPNNGHGALTTWLDEVYRAGMSVVLEVATDISHLWVDVRNGKQHYSIPSCSYSTVLEREFINNLSDRLALVSEAVLASSRMLLALFEASGISVRQAFMEQQSILPMINMGVPSLVHTVRLHQMAETYARLLPPEVLMISSMADSLLAGVFSAISSHIYTSIIVREIEASELHLNLIRDARQTFEWIHNYRDDSVTSLRNYLTRLENCIHSVMESSAYANPETKRLCDIGTAICSAEYSRLGDSEDLKKAVALLAEYNSLIEKHHQLENELTPIDKMLLALKDDFKLSWPATEWPNATVPGTRVSLVETLTVRLNEVNQDLASFGKIIDSTTLALVDKNLVSADGDVISDEFVRKTLRDFEDKFSEMSLYVRQLERLSKMCNDHECGRIWSKWLENHEIWKHISSRLVKSLTELLSVMSLECNKNKETISCVLSALKDCLQLRDHLIPNFKTLLEIGIRMVLKRSKSTAISSTLGKLGFVDSILESENSEVIESLPSCESLPLELISPQAILAMRRLYGRLQGVDDYLTHREGGDVSAVLSLTEQTNLCIQAAVDPNNLANMFEGWTPWV